MILGRLKGKRYLAKFHEISREGRLLFSLRPLVQQLSSKTRVFQQQWPLKESNNYTFLLPTHFYPTTSWQNTTWKRDGERNRKKEASLFSIKGLAKRKTSDFNVQNIFSISTLCHHIFGDKKKKGLQILKFELETYCDQQKWK